MSAPKRPTTIVPIDDVRAALIDEWRELRSLAAELDDAAWVRPSVLPGWSVADVFAHIIGTESILAGREVPDIDVSDAAHVRNPIGELNEQWIRRFATSSRTDVLDAYAEIIAERTSALNAMAQTDFDAETLTPAGPDSYGRFMQIRVFDCWIHDVDLRDTLQLPPPEQAGPAGWAVAEIFASLPFVVGKKAGATPGSRVRFDITGAATARADVEVAQRARLVDDFGSATPDLTLTVDAVQLARLVGGRRDADPASVDVAGDADLAERIVANLNYVI